MTGEELMRYRKAAGFTQEKLGLALGYSEASAERVVQLWEHDKQPIPIKHFRKLAELLRIPLEKLIP